MHWSFRLKTIVGIALIEGVLLAILVYSGVRFISTTAQTEFEQRSQATVKAFSVVAKDALIASDLAALIQELSTQMHQAAADLHFELAARLRDEVGDLKKELRQMSEATK